MKYKSVIILYLFAALFFAADLFCCFSVSAADENNYSIVRLQDVRDSLESTLRMVAVNGEPVEPTAFPKARMGDVITFVVSIHNKSSFPIKHVSAGIDWHEGLSYEGGLSCEGMDCAYDEQSNWISVDIPEILPDRKDDTDPQTYTFDLKVVDSEDLFVYVYTDELYACESNKTYPVAVVIEPPDIDYTISPLPILIGEDGRQTVTIDIENKGPGSAHEFALNTDFQDFPLEIAAVSPGFSYDAQQGAFKFDDVIDSGKSAALRFEVTADEAGRRSLAEAPVRFSPDYTDAAGTHFYAPRQYVVLKEAEKPPAEKVEEAPKVECHEADDRVRQSKEASGVLYECTDEGIELTNRYGIGYGVRGLWQNNDENASFTDDLHDGDLVYIPQTAEYNFDKVSGIREDWTGWQSVPEDRVSTDDNGRLHIDLGFIKELVDVGKGQDVQVGCHNLDLRYRVYLAEATLDSDSQTYETTSTLTLASTDEGDPPTHWEQQKTVDARKSGVDFSVDLSDVVEEGTTTVATITFDNRAPVDFEDLEIVLNHENYVYEGDFEVDGFDGKTPDVTTSGEGQLVFSFGGKGPFPEALSSGGSITIALRKDCASDTGIDAEATYATPAGLCGGTEKRETASDAPVLYNRQDLVMNVTPECTRVDSPVTPMSWTVDVINRGSGTAPDVRLTQQLGDNVFYERSGIDGEAASPQVKHDNPSPGATAVTWALGDIAPSEKRAVSVVAYPEDVGDQYGYTNTSYLTTGDEMIRCSETAIDGPCFIQPDECINGSVFGRCGHVHPFFSVAHLYESNKYRTRRDPEGIRITFLSPGLWLAVPSACDRVIDIMGANASPGGLAISPFYPNTGRIYQTYLYYNPQYEIYHDYADENMWSQRVDAYFRYDSQNKVSFRLLDQYNRSHGLFSRDASLFDRYHSNLLNTLFTYDPTQKLRFRLDYANFNIDYDSDVNRHANRMDNAWSAYAYFDVTPKTAIFANYEFAHIDYDHHFLDSRENRLFGGIRWDITRKTKGQVKGGYGRKDYDQKGLSEAETWMTEIQVDHKLSHKTRVVFNAYRRYDEPLGELVDQGVVSGDFTKYILTHFMGAALYYEVTPKLHFNLDTNLFYDDYKREETTASGKDRRDRLFTISPALRFEFKKWLTVDLSYSYTNRNSNSSRYDYDNHAVLLRANLFSAMGWDAFSF